MDAQEILISRHRQKIQFFWKFNILRRKHLFGLKLLGSSIDHETYIWEEFQVETTSFTQEKMLFNFGIFGIFGIFLGFSGFFWDFWDFKIPKIPKSQKWMMQFRSEFFSICRSHDPKNILKFSEQTDVSFSR